MSGEDFLMYAMAIGLTLFTLVCSLFFIGLMAGWWLVR